MSFKNISALCLLFVFNNNIYSNNNYSFFLSIGNENFIEVLDNINNIFESLSSQNYANLEQRLQMNNSFQELFNNIKNEDNINSRNKLFQEFCQYIFGYEYDNLREVFSIANNEQLLSIKNTLELNSFLQYMKTEYMNLEQNVTTLVNTFVEQCQEQMYGDCSNENDFNKLFEQFFKNTKEKQYISKIKQYNDVIDEIQQELLNNTTLKQQVIILLNKNFALVNKHIDDIFEQVNNNQLLCYLKVIKGDMYTDPIKL